MYDDKEMTVMHILLVVRGAASPELSCLDCTEERSHKNKFLATSKITGERVADPQCTFQNGSETAHSIKF